MMSPGNLSSARCPLRRLTAEGSFAQRPHTSEGQHAASPKGILGVTPTLADSWKGQTLAAAGQISFSSAELLHRQLLLPGGVGDRSGSLSEPLPDSQHAEAGHQRIGRWPRVTNGHELLPQAVPYGVGWIPCKPDLFNSGCQRTATTSHSSSFSANLRCRPPKRAFLTSAACATA